MPGAPSIAVTPASELDYRGAAVTVSGRSWAIQDGILDEPWDDVHIYRMIGVDAGINTFPGREEEKR